MKTCIYITTTFVGFHSWKDAPDEVAFLRHPHRHIFHVKATFEVSHDNRELEFFMIKKEIDDWIASFYPSTVVLSKSCEMIAKDIFITFSKLYCSMVSVEVSEDGENGSIVERN